MGFGGLEFRWHDNRYPASLNMVEIQLGPKLKPEVTIYLSLNWDYDAGPKLWCALIPDLM